MAKDVPNCASNARTSVTGSPTQGLRLWARISHPFLASSTFHQSSTTTMDSLFSQPNRNRAVPRTESVNQQCAILKEISLSLTAKAKTTGCRKLVQHHQRPYGSETKRVVARFPTSAIHVFDIRNMFRSSPSRTGESECAGKSSNCGGIDMTPLSPTHSEW